MESKRTSKIHRLILLILVCLLGWSLHGQETLFQDIDEDDIGAFGSPLIEIGSINGEVGSDVGGGGALVIGGFFLGGYGLGTTYPEATINGTRYDIRLKHGGLWMGYAHNQYKVIHPYSSLRLGWGKSQLLRGKDADFSERNFVLTPELGFEVNAFRFLKIAFSGGYRWVNGVDELPGLDSNDFSSAMGTVTFRIGGFGEYEDWNW
jgi:hypothetical protein